MTTPDIERELTAVLHRRAEAAMSRTDTHEELQEFHDRVEARPGGAGRRRVAAGAAVAAAVALVAGVVWYADVTGGVDDQGPAQDTGSAQTTDERVAREFAGALVDGDVAGARSFLAEGATLPDGWGRQSQRNEAWFADHDVKPCETMSTSDFGTSITCPFDYHNMRSEEMGLGPFGNNLVSLVVNDGKVRSFRAAYNSDNNGDGELYRQIGAWVRENHPGEWRFLDSQDVGPAERSRWIRLWQQRTQEYVDATTAE